MHMLLFLALVATPPRVVEGGCEGEAKRVSVESVERVSLRVLNATAETIKVFWRDRDGGRRVDMVLPPGEGGAENTSHGHLFTVTNMALDCLGLVQAGDTTSEFVILPRGPALRDDFTFKAFQKARDTAYELTTIAGFESHINKATRQAPALRAKALALLETKLNDARRIVSVNHAPMLKQVSVWIEWDRQPTHTLEYKNRSGVQLDEQSAQNPGKARAMEINDLQDFVEIVEGAQPMTVLHELAHAVFDLDLGVHKSAIEAAHKAAVARASNRATYDLKNADEYFAERTEAFFGRNDLAPHDKAELERDEPETAALIKRIWLKN